MNRIEHLIRPLMGPFCRGRLSVLIFHRVLPGPDPLLAGEPSTRQFEEAMQWVKSMFNVIPLAHGVRGLKDGHLPERALSITFDDGYANNATLAAPILARLGLHATFFIATGFLDGGRMFNDTVIESVRGFEGSELDLEELGLGRHPTRSVDQRRRAIDEVLRAIKYRPEAERESLAERLAEVAHATLPVDLMMSSAQACALAQSGFELGGHTVNHPILAQIDRAAARNEIVSGRDRLQDLAGSRVRLFAYPNGKPNRDYGEPALRLVRELGFDGAVSTSAGAARLGSDPLQIPRFTPWSRRPLRFALQMAVNATMVEPEYVAT